MMTAKGPCVVLSNLHQVCTPPSLLCIIMELLWAFKVWKMPTIMRLMCDRCIVVQSAGVVGNNPPLNLAG
jgi:hypothetical protein